MSPQYPRTTSFLGNAPGIRAGSGCVLSPCNKSDLSEKPWLQVVSSRIPDGLRGTFISHLSTALSGETVYDALGQSMSVYQCIALTLGMIVLMILLAKFGAG